MAWVSFWWLRKSTQRSYSVGCEAFQLVAFTSDVASLSSYGLRMYHSSTALGTVMTHVRGTIELNVFRSDSGDSWAWAYQDRHDVPTYTVVLL